MSKLLAKWKSLPNSVKASVAFIISNLVLRGVSFLTTPVFTRIMAQSEYGIMATYNSWLSIIDVFALLGMTSAGVFNVGMNDYRNNRDQYMSSILVLDNIATITVFALIFGLKFILGQEFMMPFNLLVLMFIHFIFNPAQIFWITRQRYEYKYKLATAITILSVFIGQIIAVIVVLNVPSNQGVWKLWSNELGVLIFAVPLYVFILVRGKTYIDKNMWKKVLIFALPLLPHYLAQHVMSGADRIMIANLVSEADAGIYNVVSNISMISVIFWSAINASLVPYTFERLNEKKYADIRGTVEKLVLAYGAICFLVVLIAPEVLRFLAPEEYYGGLFAVPPVAIVSFYAAVYNVFANIEFYHKKSVRIAMATIISAAANVGLNAWLIPRFSYIGAAYTTLASNVILIICHYIGYRKSSDDKVYNDARILLFTFALTAICLVSTLLYSNTILRFIVLGIITLIIILLRRRIMDAIKGVRTEKK